MAELRAWANSKIVDWQIQRERRRAYRDRVLIVSNHWDGSVQVFYHFLLGYFAPLCRWLQESGESKIAVRDCGPMNSWFSLLEPHINVQIVKPGKALHSIVGNRTRHHVVQGLDYPMRHNKKTLLAAREAIRGFLPQGTASSAPTLIIDRASSDDYHSGPESETEMSGARRRSVPNLQAVVKECLPSGEYMLADTAILSPTQQVALAEKATTLVGQHGAGLTHMIWMKHGSRILEIHPPLPGEAIDVYRNLAAALDHNYVRIPQETVHSEVDKDDFLSAYYAS